MKDKISATQTAILASILLCANKILSLPSLLYKYTRSDGFLLLLFMFVFDIGVLCIFFVLKNKYREESFYQIICQNWGKFFAIIIYSLLFVHFLMQLLSTFNLTNMYYGLQVYHNDQSMIFLFVALTILIVTSAGGLRSLSRTIQFFYIPIIVCLIICLLISFPNFTKPLIMFTANATSFFTGVFKYSFVFGDLLFLFLIMDKIELEKKDDLKVVKYVILTMVIMATGYFLFYSIFENTAFLHSNAISDMIVLSYEIFDIGRLDIIGAVTVMLISLSQIGVFGYILSSIILTMFPKLTKNYSIFLVVLIFCIMYGLFINTLDSLVYVITTIMPYIAISLQYFLPLFSLTFKKKGGG